MSSDVGNTETSSDAENTEEALSGAENTGKADHWMAENTKRASSFISGEARPLVSGEDGPAGTATDKSARGKPSGTAER